MASLCTVSTSVLFGTFEIFTIFPSRRLQIVSILRVDFGPLIPRLIRNCTLQCRGSALVRKGEEEKEGGLAAHTDADC